MAVHQKPPEAWQSQRLAKLLPQEAQRCAQEPPEERTFMLLQFIDIHTFCACIYLVVSYTLSSSGNSLSNC